MPNKGSHHGNTIALSSMTAISGNLIVTRLVSEDGLPESFGVAVVPFGKKKPGDQRGESRLFDSVKGRP